MASDMKKLVVAAFHDAISADADWSQRHIEQRDADLERIADELIERILPAVAAAGEAYEYAARLAQYIHDTHYPDGSPEWKPLPDLMGVLSQIDNALTGLTRAQPNAGAGVLNKKDVQWIVNDNAELGVMIHGQAFFLYKGRSLVYDKGQHDDGSPMMFRPVFKREFGECCSPINYSDPSRNGTVSLSDSDEWKPLTRPTSEGREDV
ncbi:hypothetical protein [Gemmatimonas sp.]|uniref:hypothetical protein n=1 Tax=Gemmatimonas sp. TaxID=1962908 RepID=UPI00333E2FDA